MSTEPTIRVLLTEDVASDAELEVAPGTKVRVVKTMLAEVRPHGAKPAND